MTIKMAIAEALTEVGYRLHDYSPRQPAWAVSYICMKLSEALRYAVDNS